MKILCIHQGWELYGSDRSFLLNLELLSEIYKDHLELEVVIPCDGPIVNEIKKITTKITIEDIGKIEKKQAKKNPLKSILKALKASFRARKKMKQVDLVYINTIVPFGYLIGSFLLRKKVIIHVREIPSPIVAKIFKLWFRMCRVHLIFNSYPTQKAFFMSNYKRGHVILNAVSEIPKIDIENKDNNIINLLLIGRINAWKGHEFLLNAFSKLDADFKKNYRIRFVGDSPMGQEFYKINFLSKIEGLQLSEYIEVANFTDDPTLHYNWADIVIAPSTLPEPFGRVAVEAFSNYKPVIAANHGGLSEIIIPNYNGWHFEPNNIQQLTLLLSTINQNKNTILEMGNNARKSFLEKYSIEEYQNNFKNFLNSI